MTTWTCLDRVVVAPPKDEPKAVAKSNSMLASAHEAPVERLVEVEVLVGNIYVPTGAKALVRSSALRGELMEWASVKVLVLKQEQVEAWSRPLPIKALKMLEDDDDEDVVHEFGDLVEAFKAIDPEQRGAYRRALDEADKPAI